ncbi:iron dicitrate transport regulator FecR [Leptospira gomenensis]|uniref:Iron dicitrate transport regulator FecR n=1 Tax=Leptospira gomenensis TaxID=2484974 RepID=A0A5F1Y869_9LEPT|nr:FecR family protein [Leptospira gomenensis]TGK31154.1 iron dicitrate transport regulator FecR [Leptospira gomenensis]TGK43396.1 iron dicitrate transport regulator FecR [Leptospira gomenensis]TGK45410.1 iron dicitrate transport regulator FecR [Leptospira gomenensis]TGK66277.1 iron dicitrate transport regulator FecR [Leptospira gomenensis]
MQERLLTGDRPILLVLFFNILFFSSVFLYDYTRYGYQGSQKVIGTVLFKSKTIQRKFDTEVVWREIDAGNSLQNRDTILTSEGSQAKLRLLDGTEIMIAENSMIFIDYLDNRANLEISVGGLQVTKRPDPKDSNSSPLGIRSGDGVLKLVEGIVNVEKKKNQRTLEYAVLSGTIKPDPSNPFPMIPRRSLEGFEKLFPVPASIQTTETLGATASTGTAINNPDKNKTNGTSNGTNVSNSDGRSSNVSRTNSESGTSSSSASDPADYGKYDNGNPNSKTTSSSGGNGNTSASGKAAGNGQNGINTKSDLKLERANSSREKEGKTSRSESGSSSSRTGYDPGDYLKGQKYEQNKIQEKSDPNSGPKKAETKTGEAARTETKNGNTNPTEVKKTKAPRELTPEELLRQEKEKRRREREDKEQRDFLRM